MGGRTGSDGDGFGQLAGYAAIGAAVIAIIYSVAFVLGYGLATAVALMAGGLLTVIALLGFYERLDERRGMARLGLLFGLVGAFGAAVHGAYDLGLALTPATGGVVEAGPFQVDPRGFLTFGVAGLGLIVLALAALEASDLPRPLLYVGLALGALSIVIYLARLIILNPTNPLLLGIAALTGLIVSPLFYAWLGWTLLGRGPLPLLSRRRGQTPG